MRRTAPQIGSLWLAVALVSVAGLAGCSPGALPTASVDPTDQAFESGQTPVAFRLPHGAGIALVPLAAAKPAGERDSRVVEKTIGSRGGQLVSKERESRVEFLVPPRALEARTTIRMEVTGQGAATVVRFAPSGLAFRIPCVLTISLPAGDLDPECLGGYLITEDGAEPVPCAVRVKGRRIYISMRISHFSLYSPSDGDD